MSAETLITEAEEGLRAGRLEEALAAAQNLVRSNPADSRPRLFLFSILSVLGHWERALNQIKVLKDLDPECRMLAQVFEPVVYSEILREQIFHGAGDPLIFGEPSEWIGLLVHAHRLLVQGQAEQAAAARNEAFDAAPAIPGAINGEPFEWIADADSRLGPVVEAIVQGKYYWIPFFRVHSIHIAPPKELRDLVWAPAHFKWINGGESHGFIPCRYPGAAAAADNSLRLARKTDWEQKTEDFFIGQGQRMLTTNEADYPLLEVRSIEFSQEAESIRPEQL